MGCQRVGEEKKKKTDGESAGDETRMVDEIPRRIHRDRLGNDVPLPVPDGISFSLRPRGEAGGSQSDGRAVGGGLTEQCVPHWPLLRRATMAEGQQQERTDEFTQGRGLLKHRGSRVILRVRLTTRPRQTGSPEWGDSAFYWGWRKWRARKPSTAGRKSFCLGCKLNV